MSIQAVAWALEQELPARPKLVLVSIANHANHVDGYCWLRAETVAVEASTTPRSVYRFVAALERNGYLRRERKRGADGKQRATDYWLLLDRPMAGLWTWGGVNGYHEDYDDGATTDCGPSDEPSPGENSGVVEVLVEKSDGPSVGPCDDRVTAKDSVEPSKPKPLVDVREKMMTAAVRAYKPPPRNVEPPKTNIPAPPVFVIEGTRAWKAWVEYRRSIGRPVNGSYGGEGEFKGKSGRHFASLFPPGHPDDTDEAWQARNPPQSESQCGETPIVAY